jgi:hypothetical protein
VRHPGILHSPADGSRSALAGAAEQDGRMARPGWNSMTPGFRTALVALAAVEATLLLAAQVDITRRPAKRIAGTKGAWRAVSLIEFIGPIAYFALGRVDPKERRRRARRRALARIRRR